MAALVTKARKRRRVRFVDPGAGKRIKYGFPDWRAIHLAADSRVEDLTDLYLKLWDAFADRLRRDIGKDKSPAHALEVLSRQAVAKATVGGTAAELERVFVGIVDDAASQVAVAGGFNVVNPSAVQAAYAGFDRVSMMSQYSEAALDGLRGRLSIQMSGTDADMARSIEEWLRNDLPQAGLTTRDYATVQSEALRLASSNDPAAVARRLKWSTPPPTMGSKYPGLTVDQTLLPVYGGPDGTFSAYEVQIGTGTRRASSVADEWPQLDLRRRSRRANAAELAAHGHQNVVDLYEGRTYIGTIDQAQNRAFGATTLGGWDKNGDPTDFGAFGRNLRPVIEQRVAPSGVYDSAFRILAGEKRRARAQLIAQTESMRAANAGAVGSMQDAQAENFLPVDAKLVWIVTPDSRLCNKCRPMDGKITTVLAPQWRSDSRFTDDGELVAAPPEVSQHPPLHPRCRCTVGLLESDTAFGPVIPTAQPPEPFTVPAQPPTPLQVTAPGTNPVSLLEDIEFAERSPVARDVVDAALPLIDDLIRRPELVQGQRTLVRQIQQKGNLGGRWGPVSKRVEFPKYPARNPTPRALENYRRKKEAYEQARLQNAQFGSVIEVNRNPLKGLRKGSQEYIEKQIAVENTFIHEYGHRLDFMPGRDPQAPGTSNSWMKHMFSNTVGKRMNGRIKERFPFQTGATDVPRPETFSSIREQIRDIPIEELMVGEKDPAVLAMAEFQRRAFVSDAYLALGQYNKIDPGWVQYARSPVELWARAFNQWVVNRNPAGVAHRKDLLKRSIGPEGMNSMGYQWTTEEFEESIGPAVERVLRELGHLKDVYDVADVVGVVDVAEVVGVTEVGA